MTDILTLMFSGKLDFLKFLQLRQNLAVKVYEHEYVPVDKSSWELVRDCIMVQFGMQVPDGISVLVVLTAIKLNLSIRKIATDQFLRGKTGETLQADTDFINSYMELIDWAIPDYLCGDPKNHQKWIITYGTLANAWLDKRIPAKEHLQSVCTITAKKSKNPPKRKNSSAKGKGKGSGKRTRKGPQIPK